MGTEAMTPISARVTRLVREASDIVSYELDPATPVPFPPIDAGAHIDVRTPSGLIRQYSLCNRPGAGPRYQIAVKREALSRGGSQSMHDGVAAGDVIAIGAPRNAFALTSGAHHILLAGGIGITPLLSIPHRLTTAKASFELHYFTRSAPHETAFREVLARDMPAGTVRAYHDLQPAAVGATLAGILAARVGGAHLYICGPVPFMALAEGTAAAWPASSVHREYFTAIDKTTDRASFSVRIASTGRDIVVGADQTIVKALAAHEIRIETSCEQGVCGTCLTGFIDGIPDHRDTFLSDDDRALGDRICACISRCRSGVLTLDL